MSFLMTIVNAVDDLMGVPEIPTNDKTPSPPSIYVRERSFTESTSSDMIRARRRRRPAPLLTRTLKRSDSMNSVSSVDSDISVNSEAFESTSPGETSSEITPVEKKKKHIQDGDSIKFEHVNLVTPNDTLLVKDLNFEVVRGKNMLITGPNGTGKSSLFRVLGGLWYIQDGIIKKPGGATMNYNEVYYVPQKQYNALGTLRDQIIYPEAPNATDSKNYSDEQLMGLLRRVNIDYIVEREGGFDLVKNWDDILSLGEQQRLAFARLFYHKPKFAVLDECTSAISVDIEASLYDQCKELDITCITISLRPALKPYHDVELAFDGEGRVVISDIDHNADVEA